MNQRNIDLVEKCIELMNAGLPIEDCVKEYPEVTPEIQEILMTAKNVTNLREERVPIEAMNRNRLKILAQAKQIVTNDELTRSRSGFIFTGVRTWRTFTKLFSVRSLAGRLILVILVTGLLIIFSRGLVITSAKTLPGDSLYPVKRAVEDISMHLVTRSEVRQEYEDNYDLQRVEEVISLLQLKRIQPISFEGVLEFKSDTNWIVSKIPIKLQTDTTIVGGIDGMTSFELGSVVEVEGVTDLEGYVSASEIHLREYQFTGTVEKITANVCQISGTLITVNSKTQIGEGIQTGDRVTILIRSEDKGTYALAILRDLYSVPTPMISPLLTSTPTSLDDHIVEVDEESHMAGVLEATNDSYWVVSGQIFYDVSDVEISDEINIGDSISVDYQVEANGSFTAIKIERNVNDEPSGEGEVKEEQGIGPENDSKDMSFHDQ